MARKKLASSIPRNWLILEALFDWNTLDTNDWTKTTITATNITYTNTIKGYQKQKSIFNGSSSKASIPWSTINLWTWDFSISLWATTSVANNQQVLISNLTTSSVTWFSLTRNSDNTILCETWQSWSSSNLNSTNNTYWTLNDTHIVFCRGATWSSQLYINWVLEKQQTLSVKNVTSTSVMDFWRYTFNNTLFWNWNIQWARIYNRVLSQQEIQNLYQEWLRQLWRWSDNILSSAVAQFRPMDWNTTLSNIIWWTTATYVWGTSTTDNFWITWAITNPNYTWSSITYTTWYTFENSWSSWWIVTSPSWLNATWINRTTTLREIFLMSRTLSADEVTELERLCKIKYLYQFKKTFPLNLNDWKVLHLAWDINWTTLYDLSWNWDATISSTPVIKRQLQHKYISLTSQSITWSSRTIWTSLCWEKISWKWTLQINPAYITSTWITSTTKDLANIYITTRTLSINEIQNYKYSTFIS